MPRTMTERQERELRTSAKYSASAVPGLLFLEIDSERDVSRELAGALEALLDISPFATGGDNSAEIHRLAETAVAKFYGVGLETVRVCAIQTQPEAKA